MYQKTTVVVDRILDIQGDLVIVSEAGMISSYNLKYYRIVLDKEGKCI